MGSGGEDQSNSSNSSGMELEQRLLDGAREAREAREAGEEREDSDGDTRWEEASSGGEWADARE